MCRSCGCKHSRQIDDGGHNWEETRPGVSRGSSEWRMYWRRRSWMPEGVLLGATLYKLTFTVLVDFASYPTTPDFTAGGVHPIISLSPEIIYRSKTKQKYPNFRLRPKYFEFPQSLQTTRRQRVPKTAIWFAPLVHVAASEPQAHAYPC